MKRLRRIGLALAALLLLAGCDRIALPLSSHAQSPVSVPSEPQPLRDAPQVEPIRKTEGQGTYQAPSVAENVFRDNMAEGNETVRIDLSECRQGYVAVAATSANRMKTQILKDDTVYTYDLSSDGTPSFYPFQCGDGVYTIRVMENVQDTKYAIAYSTEVNIRLENEFCPFLRPNDYVRYTASSDCVQIAETLAANADTPLEAVAAIYEYITNTIRYDHDKAATVSSGYVSDPDETLKNKRGICFDYASLAAAMLRSRGIPCKIIFGYVAPNDIYHAWNMFYTEETGWVTVSFKANGKAWNRIDLTFSASGESDAFIAEGSNYTDLYYY